MDLQQLVCSSLVSRRARDRLCFERDIAQPSTKKVGETGGAAHQEDAGRCAVESSDRRERSSGAVTSVCCPSRKAAGRAGRMPDADARERLQLQSMRCPARDHHALGRKKQRRSACYVAAHRSSWAGETAVWRRERAYSSRSSSGSSSSQSSPLSGVYSIPPAATAVPGKTGAAYPSSP